MQDWFNIRKSINVTDHINSKKENMLWSVISMDSEKLVTKFKIQLPFIIKKKKKPLSKLGTKRNLLI